MHLRGSAAACALGINRLYCGIMTMRPLSLQGAQYRVRLQLLHGFCRGRSSRACQAVVKIGGYKSASNMGPQEENKRVVARSSRGRMFSRQLVRTSLCEEESLPKRSLERVKPSICIDAVSTAGLQNA